MVRWCLEDAKLKVYGTANRTLYKNKEKILEWAMTDNNREGNQSGPMCTDKYKIQLFTISADRLLDTSSENA